MKNKLELYICRCGHLHFYNNEKLHKSLEANKELVLICSNCGEVLHIGADIRKESGKVLYDMYSFIETDMSISESNFSETKNKKAINEIIIDTGKPVFMKTGYTADTYNNAGFYDLNSKFVHSSIRNSPELYSTLETKYNNRRGEINLSMLASKLNYDELLCLRKLYIPQIDWESDELKNILDTKKVENMSAF